MSKLVHTPKLEHSFGKVKERLAAPETEVREPYTHTVEMAGFSQEPLSRVLDIPGLSRSRLTIRSKRTKLGLGQVPLLNNLVKQKGGNKMSSFNNIMARKKLGDR